MRREPNHDQQKTNISNKSFEFHFIFISIYNYTQLYNFFGKK